MSLLLDALKKAADDKEKKSREESALKEKPDVTASATDQNQAETETLRHQPNNDSDNISEPQSGATKDDLVELSLDDIEVAEEDTLLKEKTEAAPQQEKDLGIKRKEQTSDKEQRSAKGSFAISDEALSMLIYKTNHDVKKDRRVFLSSVLIVSLLILVTGGIYYYMDMETEIEALERKHQIAMQSMRSKTNKEKTPGKSEIIRNLVTDAELEAKVEHAQKRIAKEESPVREQAAEQSLNNRQVKTNPVSSRLSIQRTNKIDAIGEQLTDAWLAYENARYAQAKQLYKDILVAENSNRDALLGLGAIAVIEKDTISAREIYLSLLELDPRDPIATAALASLHSDESSLGPDEEYLLSMLKKNPDAPHLNFALGNVYARLDKWTAAQQRYFNAWQHDEENADYIFNLAVSMDQLSKPEQAIAFYKDSLVRAENKQVSFSREDVQIRINELTRL